MPPRRHHYIPIFYLKQWAGDDGRICQYSRPHKEIVANRKHPSATAYQDDLYTVTGLPPEAAHWIEEKFLLLADQRANDSLQLMLSGRLNELNGNKKSDWTRCLMTILSRNPERIALLKERWAIDYAKVMENIRSDWQAMRRDGDPATFEEFAATIGEMRRQHATVRLMQNVMDLERPGQHINNMHWAVIEAIDLRLSFLTADRPLIMPLGLQHEQAHIGMPISPRQLFVASNEPALINSLARMGARDLITHVNENIVKQALKYVYAVDDRQLRFLENRRPYVTQGRI